MATSLGEHTRKSDSPSKKEIPLLTRISAGLCDAIESFLNIWLTVKEEAFLSGAFAPVEEGSLEKDLVVKGELPACLNGEFVRNGPNPRLKPSGGYHWFDGDGMLHGLRIIDGKAHYVNRYVRTSRLAQEEAYGKPLFIKIGDMSGYVGLAKLLLSSLRQTLGVVDVSNGSGTGNTALVFHNKRLMATNESDAPYVVKVLEDGELETVGRDTFGGALDHSFTAHPKVDPVTGEMFTFGYNVEKAPYLNYRVVSAKGEMGDKVPINLPRPVMMHDFAITEHSAIFMDLPFLFEPKEIVKSGFAFKFDPLLPSRFGVLPRYAKSEALIKWFTLPSFFIFHTGNAWEEGDEVVLLACQIPHLELNSINTDGQKEEHVSSLHEYRFNLKTGEAASRQLSPIFSDFPRINEKFLGRKQRYVYSAVFLVTKIIGVAKFDLTLPVEASHDDGLPSWAPRLGGACVGYFSHGKNRFGSEAVFVPSGDGAEDDGYLLNFVHNEGTGVSEVVVIDAKTMAAEPVAVVTLPRRVPYGFHGIFVNEEQLKAQEPGI